MPLRLLRRRAATAPIPAMPVRMLSVGRAVEKKGFDVLLAALARLAAGLRLALDPYRRRPASREARSAGRGGRAREPDRLARRAGPGGGARRLPGSRPLRAALPGRGDGDRDGLPNVLVEAQSQGLACLSTDVSGVAELIEAERTGAARAARRCRRAWPRRLLRLIGDPRLRRRLGRAGAQRVHASFRRRAASVLAKLLDLLRRVAPPMADAA